MVIKETIKRFLKLLGLVQIFSDIKNSFYNKIKEKEREIFYSQFIKEGDLCFDIGANIGNRTDIFRSLGARVVAVEPQNSCMKKLKRKYRDEKGIILVEKALGEKIGKGTIYLNESETLSSMSKEWMHKVGESGRFHEYKWKGEQTIDIVTLDSLIEKYGRPIFCKIDVEGFEYKVLKGLSIPIKYMSFEFASESLETSISCIRHLLKIGKYVFNYSKGENMCLELTKWISSSEMENLLINLEEKESWGDIYASLIDKN
jgi:FkbM family methyltransferase